MIDRVETKLSMLKAAAAARNWREALRIAAKFHELGRHKEAITRAWAAIQSPRVYAEMEQHPEALIAAGIAALKERYSL